MLIRTLTLATTLALAGPALAAVAVGQNAPAFSALDTAGKTVSLADFKGRAGEGQRGRQGEGADQHGHSLRRVTDGPAHRASRAR